MKGDFSHVTLLRPITETHALYIDPRDTHTEVQLREFNDSFAREIAVTATKTPVVSFIHTPVKSRLVSNIVPSCVSVVKVTMGIDNHCVTPKGLYNYLLANGGVVI